MSDPFGALPGSHDRISIPTLWVAFALSLMLHALGLVGWTQKVHLPFEEPRHGKPSGSLAVRLLPPPSPPPVAASPSRTPLPPRPALTAPPPKTAAVTAPEPARLPRVPLIDRPSPLVVPPPAEAARPAPAEDLAAYIASRRRAREGASPAPAPQPSETEQERHNRMVAENLGLTSTPTFGSDPDRGGGVFQIRSMGYDIAQFAFFGWNKDINRNSLQVIEVRRGDSSTMELAVARKMISIIRERSGPDFLWQSQRTGRSQWLSARLADTAELEGFIMREFFPAPRPR